MCKDFPLPLKREQWPTFIFKRKMTDCFSPEFLYHERLWVAESGGEEKRTGPSEVGEGWRHGQYEVLKQMASTSQTNVTYCTDYTWACSERTVHKKKKVAFLSFKITIKFISGEKNSKNAWKNGREAVLSLQPEQETRTLTSCGITVNPKLCWVKPPSHTHTYTHLVKSRTHSKMLGQGHHCWMNGNYSRWSSLKMVYFFLHTFALYHFPQFGRKSLVFFVWILVHLASPVYVFSVHFLFLSPLAFPLLGKEPPNHSSPAYCISYVSFIMGLLLEKMWGGLSSL